MPKPSKSVLLIGDSIQDRYLLPLSNSGHKNEEWDWKNHRQWKEYPRPGGVNFLAAMLESSGIKIAKLLTPTGRELESLAILGACKLDDDEFPLKFTQLDTSDNPKDYRLRVQRDLGYRDTGRSGQGTKVLAKPPRFDILAISDAGNELRRDEGLCNFIKTSMDGTDKPIVLKTHLPLGTGMIWEAFKGAKGKQRVVIIQSDDLREAGAKIRRGVPWDRVIEDLHECRDLPPLSGFLEADVNVIVLFGVEAAAVFELEPHAGHHMTFVCDPACAEGQVEAEVPGAMVGYMSAFMTALIDELIKSPDGRLPTQVKEGMLVMRAFASAYWNDTNGHLCLESLPKLKAKLSAWAEANAKKQNVPRYIIVEPSPHDRPNLLRDVLRAKGDDMSETCLQIATEIVDQGARSQVNSLPHAEFGKLLTLDVSEIEALRGIARLIQDYNSDRKRAKPISFAVFGPPGAGKSFGVKQLVDTKVNPVEEFNLSQATEADLPLFFQKIRDQNLQGKTPLCFFDEFDSGNRQLLKFFLAPMQDGEYRDGDAIRPIGRGIFVFAGGTASQFQDFAGLGHMTEQERQDFDSMAKQTKSPDFVSRLSGYLNVTGVSAGADNEGTADLDREVIRLLHRAILVRSMLEQYLPELAPKNAASALSKDLIRWLLTDWKPTHGARSIETVIRGIAANKHTTKIGLSDLPMDILATIHTAQD